MISEEGGLRGLQPLKRGQSKKTEGWTALNSLGGRLTVDSYLQKFMRLLS